jgi:H+/gluconate symporter-like permease
MLVVPYVLAAVRKVTVDPKPTGLPGSRVLQGLVDGLAFWALLACLAAMIVAAAVWAFASHSNNHHYTANGRRGLLTAALAALAIGASAALVNFFAEAGDKVR